MLIVQPGRDEMRATGVPRNEHVESVVRAQLQELDGLLDIKWFPHHGGRYALTCTWSQADRRWELYHAGDIGEPFDILGWFVEPGADGDMSVGSNPPVDPELLMDKIRELLGRMDNTRSTFRQRMLSAVEHNAKRRRAVADSVKEPTIEALDYYARLHVGQPMVHLGDGTKGSIQAPTNQPTTTNEQTS